MSRVFDIHEEAMRECPLGERVADDSQTYPALSRGVALNPTSIVNKVRRVFAEVTSAFLEMLSKIVLLKFPW